MSLLTNVLLVILLALLLASIIYMVVGFCFLVYEVYVSDDGVTSSTVGASEVIVLACSSCGYPIEKKQINLLTDDETFEYCVMCGETRVFTRKE